MHRMTPSEIFDKLRLKEEMSKLIINAPREYKTKLQDIVYDYKNNNKEYDFVQVFATSHVELQKAMKDAAKAGKADCLFWACYPKGGGRIKSDINRDTLWTAVEKFKWRPVSQVSIDDNWSAMRLQPIETVKKTK